MQAIILVGGLGTRLRPLTNNVPKAAVPMMNKEFLTYQLKLLANHGIQNVILAVCHLSDYLQSCLSDVEQYGLNITYVAEETPLGTAGAIKNCESLIDDSFFVMTGDLLTTIDLTEMNKFHGDKNAFITVCTKELDDPTGYGLIEHDENRKLIRFIEKPQDWRKLNTRSTNTAVWLMERGVLDFIPEDTNCSAEHELFPALLKAGKPIYAYPTSEYWIDFGNPSRYVRAHRAILDGEVPIDHAIEISERVWSEENVEMDQDAELCKPLYLGKNCKLGAGAEIGDYTVLGSDCNIGAEAKITNSILWENTVIGEGASVKNCILCRECQIGDYAKLSNCVLGDGTVIPSYSKNYGGKEAKGQNGKEVKGGNSKMAQLPNYPIT